MPARPGFGLGAVLVAALAGCSPGAASPPPAGLGAADGPDEGTASLCVEPGDEQPLAILAGDGCPWMLEHGEGDELRLRILDATGAVSVGREPPACASLRCDFHGVATTAGPVLVVEVPSVHTELPREIWVGLVGEGRLELVESWSGPPVQGDAADLGPAWSLEPHVCGDRIGLLAVRRHAVGSNPTPPAVITSREGLVSIGVEGLTLEPLDDSVRSRCEPAPGLAY